MNSNAEIRLADKLTITKSNNISNMVDGKFSQSVYENKMEVARGDIKGDMKDSRPFNLKFSTLSAHLKKEDQKDVNNPHKTNNNDVIKPKIEK